MKTLTAALLAALILAAFAAPAVAAPARAAPAKPQVKHFHLKGSDIEGTLIQPDGRWIQHKADLGHKSLIEVRLDFVPELLKLSDEL